MFLYLLCVLFFLSIAIESLLFKILPDVAIAPSLHFILVFELSMRFNSNRAMFILFCMGMIVDGLCYQHLGVSSLLFLIIGSVLGKIKRNFILSSFTEIYLIFSIATVIFILLKLFFIVGWGLFYMDRYILLLHILLTILIYPLMYILINYKTQRSY